MSLALSSPPPTHLNGLLGRLLAGVLGVAARLAVEDVDVDEVAEAAEHVLQRVRRRRGRVAHDEQPADVGGGRRAKGQFTTAAGLR